MGGYRYDHEIPQLRGQDGTTRGQSIPSAAGGGSYDQPITNNAGQHVTVELDAGFYDSGQTASADDRIVQGFEGKVWSDSAPLKESRCTCTRIISRSSIQWFPTSKVSTAACH